MNRRRTFTILLGVSVIAAATCVFAVAPATADTAAAPGSAEWFSNQAALDSFDATILAVVDPTEGAELHSADGRDYGYAGLVNSPGTAEVTLYWVGDVPSNIQTLIDAAPSDIDVAVRAGAYTEFQAIKAARALTKPGAIAGTAPMAQIGTVSPDPHGQGLLIDYSVTAAAASPAADAARSAANLGVTAAPTAAQVMAASENLTGLPVVSATLQPAATALDSRWSDSAPYDGGTGIAFVVTNPVTLPPGTTPPPAQPDRCTESFPLQSPSTGSIYLLTAYHCFHQWDKYASTPQLRLLVSSPSNVGQGYYDPETVTGTFTNVNTRNFPGLDATIIQPKSQSVSNSIFIGAYNSSSKIALAGFGDNVAGNLALTDGAETGSHTVLITSVGGTVFRDFIDANVSGIVTATATAGGAVAAGAGDSGGPVYSYDGSGNYYGIGMIEVGTDDLPCTSGYPTTCDSVVQWVGLKTILATTGFSLY